MSKKVNENTSEELLKYDTTKALEFLMQQHTAGIIALSSIYESSIETVCFAKEQESLIKAWLESKQNKANLYYHVNSIEGHISKKASKEDIHSIDHLHVDLDISKGCKDPDSERAKICNRVMNYPIPPTYLVLTGGGYQAVWKLKEPIILDGDDRDKKIADAERRSKKIAQELGGDNCHNIDRLLRLPFTVNVLSSKKISDGRTKAVAELVFFEPSRTYDINQFEKAESSIDSDKKSVISNFKIGNVRTFDDLEGFAHIFPEWLTQLIITGKNLSKDYPSRSEALFAVVCKLVRLAIDDELIFSIITDSRFAISSSILEQPNPDYYANRQISRAKDFIINPLLDEMNSKHAVVKNWGGKCVVVTEKYDYELESDVIDLQSFDDIRKAYINRPIRIGTKKDSEPLMSPLGDYWLKHPARREYDSVTFAPNSETPHNIYNLWHGLAVKPKQGCCGLIKNHILEVIADNNVEHAEYITKWLAYAIQHPEKLPEVALVLKGGKGTGKGTLGNLMCRIFGQHGLYITNMAHIAGNFNGHLANTCFLFADEAYFPGDKSSEGTMKGLITEPHFMLEKKGVDAIQMRNRLSVMMASNESWVVNASEDERRYAVFDISDKHKQDVEYFTALHQQIKNGGQEAFLYDLLALDLDGWHPRYNTPQTNALAEQKLRNLQPIEKLWYDCLDKGQLKQNLTSKNKSQYIVSTSSFADAVNIIHKYNDYSARNIADFFKSMNFKYSNSRPRGYFIPDLQIARKAWDEVLFEVEWDDSPEWEIGW